VIRSSLTAATLALSLALGGAALAQKAAPAAKHGGQTAVVAGHHDAELVIKPDAVLLYLSNHGKPLVPKDDAIKATIQDGATTTELLMKTEGDHVVAKIAAPLKAGTVILLSGKVGGHGMSARFVAK
jgi:SpoU rRNA methylase family enzyme